MLRIALFFATNIAILVVLSIVFQLLGLEGILAENQVDLNLQALLVMSAVIGFSGSFISLLISKWMAKRSMGVQIIDPQRPANDTERWLLSTVQRQAQQDGTQSPQGQNVETMQMTQDDLQRMMDRIDRKSVV